MARRTVDQRFLPAAPGREAMNRVDVTSTLSASLAGKYRIEREIGAGGMAVVYLAHDLRHDRRVAVKVLRPELAAILGAERFLQEIKTTANLQHPHILALLDSGEARAEDASGFGGSAVLWYAMPYVAGASLRDRLQREKQLPVDDALRIVHEVGDALDYAHRHGVIHRDIKPENILLAGYPDEARVAPALVADFGIALAVSAAGGGRMTETGMSLGTPQYMSPEQAMGERELTARSDVYALACVLYEMLVGEPPFTGATAQQILGRVLTAEPVSITSQRRTVPPHVDVAVLTALEKLPADRFSTVAEFLAALGGATAAASVARHPTGTRPQARGPQPVWWRRLALVAAAAAVGASAVAAWSLRRQLRARDPQVTRYALAFPKGEEPVGPAFYPFVSTSRDASRLVYFALPPQGPPIFRLHDATKLETQSLGAAGSASSMVCISPNGDWVAYTSGSPGDLRKIPVSGGTSLTLVRDSATAAWAQWATDGWIYFTLISGALARVPENGGDIEILARPDTASGVRQIIIPDILPGSRAAIVTLFQPAKGGSEIAALEFSSGKIHRLVGGQVGRYVKTGHLVFSDYDANLLAAPFDPRTLRLTGVPRRVGVQVAPNGVFAISETGTLVHHLISGTFDGRPTWVERDGTAHVVDSAWGARITTLALSPDASRAAVSVPRGGAENIWVKQLDKGPFTRLTNDGGQNYRPAWTHDGKSLTFVSDVDGIQKIFRIRADGTGGRHVVARAFTNTDEGALSADEQWAVLRVGNSGRRDVVAYHAGDTVPVMIAATPAEEYSPALSPDGRWVSYVSDESGRAEVYVRPFPHADSARVQVSVAGGIEPVWAPSGRELFYRDAAFDLVAVEVTLTPSFRLGRQRRLFSTRPYYVEGLHAAYGVTRDAKRFLFLANPEDAGSHLVVVHNWLGELESIMASTGRNR